MPEPDPDWVMEGLDEEEIAALEAIRAQTPKPAGGRFKVVTDEDLDEIELNTISYNTKIQTKWGVTAMNGEYTKCKRNASYHGHQKKQIIK